MERERALHAHAERVLADGERLAAARPLTLDHDPLEDLDALPAALDHSEVHAHGVARLELRNLAQLAALDVLDDRAHGKKGLAAAGNGSELSESRRGRVASTWRRSCRRCSSAARFPTPVNRRTSCGCRLRRSTGLKEFAPARPFSYRADPASRTAPRDACRRCRRLRSAQPSARP